MNNSNAEFDNVTLKNCSVIGHRDVGALVGGMQSGTSVLTLKNTIALDNVKVKTVGGRSGLVVGKISYSTAKSNSSKIVVDNNATININNSALSIYEDTAFKQEFATPDAVPDAWTENRGYHWTDMDKMIRSIKATDGSEKRSVYGFKSDSLVGVEHTADSMWSAITSVDALRAYDWNN